MLNQSVTAQTVRGAATPTVQGTAAQTVETARVNPNQAALDHELMVLANYREIFAFSPLYGGVTQADIDAQQAKVDDLSSFAVGTPNVPHDMIANIHKGEIIVPENFSNGLRNGSLTMGSNDAMVSELKAQNSLLNGIISELREQTRIVDESLDVQNETLEKIEKIEEAG